MRQQRIERAFFRGARLTLENPAYRRAVQRLTEALVQDDLAGGDLTSIVMGVERGRVSATVLAREAGVVAGLEEFCLLYRGHGVEVTPEMRDGDVVRPHDQVLRLEGDQGTLLALERVGLNLLQRMSGIASASRCLRERVLQCGSATRVVGTRKTPWGLLDKRALHLGKVGTHRLHLGEAILIKNNHLSLLGGTEEEAVTRAIAKAWSRRGESAFIEVEVRTLLGARAAALAFREAQEEAQETATAGEYPCILMLDNRKPGEVVAILEMLHRERLWDYTLVEASGRISESNIEEYAAAGVDAISMGSLTHSVRALDLSQRIL